MKNKLAQRKDERKKLDQLMKLERWNPSCAPGTNVHLEVQGVDISSGGMGISSSYEFQVGEIVKIEYALNGRGVNLPLYLEVVWSAAGQGKSQLGLRFLC